MADKTHFDPYHRWLGIPPDQQPPNHYRLLRLEIFEADPDVIETAYYKEMENLKQQEHSEHAELAIKITRELVAAKNCLLKGESKAAYDAQLRTKASEDKRAEQEARKLAIESAVRQATTEMAAELDDLREQAKQSSERVPQPPATAKQPYETGSVPSQSLAPSSETPHAPPQFESRGLSPSTAQRGSPPISRDEHERNGATIVFLAAGASAIVLLAVVALAVLRLSQDDTSDDEKGKREHLISDNKKEGARQLREPSEVIRQPESVKLSVIQQEVDGSFHFPVALATLEGPTLERANEGPKDVITNWSNNNSISWKFRVDRTGFFKAEVAYTAEESSTGGRYLIEIGKMTSKVEEVRTGNPPGSVVTDELFVVISRKGLNQIRLRAVEISGGELMKFHSLKLIPRGS